MSRYVNDVRDPVSDVSPYPPVLNASHMRALRLESAFNGVADYAIFSLDADGVIQDWNAAADSVLGYSRAEIVGRNFAILFTPEDQANAVPDIVLRRLKRDGKLVEHRWFQRKDGSRFIGSEKIRALGGVANEPGRMFVVIAHDLTERNLQSPGLRHPALIDALTNLPDRRAFYGHLRRAVKTLERRPAALFAVMFVGLDRSMASNDGFGHLAGDVVLEATARRLERCTRSDDVVARIGGAEFAVLLNGIQDVADAQDAAGRVDAEMRKPVSIGNPTLRATVSIGIALGHARHHASDEILRDADAALAAARAAGPSRVETFAPHINLRRPVDRDHELDLRRAIERHELRVVYQPIMYLPDASLWGFEALARWQHPCRGIISPNDFIPMAEYSGLVGSIDRWVLREACSTFAGWRSRYAADALALSVNMSSRSFSYPAAVQHLADVLRITGMPANTLHIEIAESAMMKRSEATHGVLRAMRNLGVELLIDDFGVGALSLAALARLPVAGVKLDRTFLTGLDTPRGAALAGAIATLTRDLGLALIAEGIEESAQVDALMSVGCEIGQGFFYSQPLDAEAAGALIRRLDGNCPQS